MSSLFLAQHVIVGHADRRPIKKVEVTGQDLEESTWTCQSKNSITQSDMANALRSFGVHNLKFVFQSESGGAIVEKLLNTDFLNVLHRDATRQNEHQSSRAQLALQLKTSKMVIGVATPANLLEKVAISIIYHPFAFISCQRTACSLSAPVCHGLRICEQERSFA